MISLKKKAISTSDLLQNTTRKISDDIEMLLSRKRGALSMFQLTMDELSEVNENLHASISELNGLIDFATDAKTKAESSIKENQHIQTKIREIIGEDK